MTTIPLRQPLVLFLLLALLAGCGWQLRGASTASLAERALHVRSQTQVPELEALVARNLRLAGAQVVAVGAAEAAIVLLDEQLQRRPVSVSQNAQVQEYELGYQLRYRLERDGAPVGDAQVVIVSQVFRNDANNVLSVQAQEATLTAQLRQDAIRLLLPRIEAALRETQE
jgi:LPS-assembly lipoprotein